MNSNCMFAYPDRTLAATISTTGTAWLTTLPLDNLKNRLKSKVARSAGITTAHTKFDITLAQTQTVTMLAILNHNASYMQPTTATVTLSFSNVALGEWELGHVIAEPLWASAYYPEDAPLEWMDANFWDGTLSMADAADYQASPDFWYVLPDVVNCKYVRVEISDPDNPAGFFQLGRCFVATGWQPRLNLSYGASMMWRQDINKDTSLSGVDWFRIRSKGREVAFQLENMTEADGMVLGFDAQRRLGLEGELFFIFDPADTIGLYKQRAMLCRHADLNPLEYPYFAQHSMSYKLSEVR